MKNLIKDFTNEFREIKEPIKVISHLDADGLTSAAIISKTLKRNDNEFSLSIVRQLDEDKIRELLKVAPELKGITEHKHISKFIKHEIIRNRIRSK